MAKIKINKEEIEKMLKDQLEVKEVKWNEDGSAEVELDLDEIKKKEKNIVITYPTYPIYIIKPEEKQIPQPYRPYPYWYITTPFLTTDKKTGHSLTYCSTNIR